MKVLANKIPQSILVLGVIILVGIFLRTYQFHDWLRFNADQSRDAGVVSSFIEGKESLPLLGPKAGGTNFRLGGAFYYFQIAAAKVFGNEPDKMAYPDLFFSILTIPLLFFFLKKYFSAKSSLMLVAVFAVSFYAIKYSRFAWNPNSLPFWSVLFIYALHSMTVAFEKSEKIWIWTLAAGISLGVGVQLHTLSLVFFPVMLVGVFGYLLIKKKNVWKNLLAIVFVVLMLNAGQLYSEYGTGGENIGAFFGGIGTKEKKGSGALNNAVKDTLCFSQANVYILSSYDISDSCELKSAKTGRGLLASLLGFVFLVGGFVLAVWHFKKEQDYGKKVFLGLFLFYLSVSFLVLLPLSNEISMRFFLVIAFMPFVLLGLWFKYLSEKFSKIATLISLCIVFLLVATNVFSVRNSFAENASYTKQSDAGMDNVTLKEVELAATFITNHSQGAKLVYLDGDVRYLFKALKSIEYFTQRDGINISQKGKKALIEAPVFLVENSKNKDKVLGKNVGIVDYESMGRFTIFKQN